MPDPPLSDDLGALIWRVRTLEDRVNENGRTMNAMREQQAKAAETLIAHADMQHERTLRHLKDNYLSAEQTANRYVSRAEQQNASSGRREWLLVWVAIVATIAPLLQLALVLAHQ